MSRPAKMVGTIDNSVSRRTKAELETREKGEKALLSGVKVFERDNVKDNPVAHKEFLRIKSLTARIGKDDALYGPVYNRYCELFAECVDYVQKRADLLALVDKLEEKFDEFDSTDYDTIQDFAKQVTAILKQANALDGQIMQRRKMMFDIEKENCMTVSGAIRTIPKKPDKEDNPLASILSGDDD